MVQLFIALTSIGLFVVIPLTILGPFVRAVKGKNLKFRFQVIDFIWLIALLQYPLALLLIFQSRRDGSNIQFIGGLLVTGVVLAWLRGTAVLSGLSIHDMVRRGVFLVILLPAALLGAIFGLTEEPAPHIGYQPSAQLEPLVRMCGLLLLAFVLRKVSGWVLAGSRENPEPMRDESA
jgi:hypothetical protein